MAGKASAHAHSQGHDNTHAAAPKPADLPRHAAEAENAYDRASMGAPCGPWNRDLAACDKAGKGESHGSAPNRFTHIWGYCANAEETRKTRCRGGKR